VLFIGVCFFEHIGLILCIVHVESISCSMTRLLRVTKSILYASYGVAAWTGEGVVLIMPGNFLLTCSKTG